ncbi:uncharacterized protein LOC124444604 [Xenia sp. Carnegie-2017]|uniref:uncharacterized protein LOC124444604 n=1 Tax=Xenia sp. Carnegie-2017 TaxID=2897299 RepID=UPI001F04D463|nr:uncharacterized protein LOC124444604 [Xenia sp. Carnegie-2017]XP_046851174.1 uncharacterized protein LOC124444604 [Xenia sp. Carnegie-2017]
MIPNAIKLLIFVVVIWSVKARPDFELKAVEEKILNKYPKIDEIVENDQKFKVPYVTPKTNKLTCPFNCEYLCIIKVGNEYQCNKLVDKCCKNECTKYWFCLKAGNPSWLCEVQTFDKICECRSSCIGKRELKHRTKA